MENIDIYFTKEYGKSSEFLYDGICDEYSYQDENGKVKNIFLKRKIDISIDDKTYYDIATPYGYGGPIITELTGDKDKLVKSYMEKFEKYCQENNIVSEFVRFHPIIENYKDFKSVYDTVFMRKTVATITKDKEDPFQEEFSKSARKTVRKVLKEELEYEVIAKPENLDTFIKVYYDTMDRNEAGDFYYFSEEYFQYLLDNLRENLLNINILKDDIYIASGLYFVNDKFLHAHLSGTRHEYLTYSPAYMLKYLTCQYAHEHKIDFVHYGGGTTNAEDDPLFMFKSKFTKEGIFDFYIGKKIFNQDIYDKLFIASGNKDTGFFPAYRK